MLRLLLPGDFRCLDSLFSKLIFFSGKASGRCYFLYFLWEQPLPARRGKDLLVAVVLPGPVQSSPGTPGPMGAQGAGSAVLPYPCPRLQAATSTMDHGPWPLHQRRAELLLSQAGQRGLWAPTGVRA